MGKETRREATGGAAMKYLDYPEQQKYEDQDFPFFFYHVTFRHPRYEMPYHWHPLWEIVHVHSGRFRIHMDHKELCLSQGDTALVAPGVIHGGRPQEGNGCCYECLLIDSDTVFQSVFRIYERRLLDLLSLKFAVEDYFPASDAEIRGLFEKMLDCMRYKPQGYTLQMQGMTVSLFGVLLQERYFRGNNPGQKQRSTQIFKTVMAYIDGHYQEHITLSDLASSANMTPNYFCRYFKGMTGRTPMDYLNYYRIEAACERLSYSEKSITEVALDCGFQDPSYFVKVFKHYKHATPSAYLRARS